MKQLLHKTKYYIIEIDQKKNRLLVKPLGFWRSEKVVPKYLKRIIQAIDEKLTTGFTCILDASDMLTHPQEVQEKVHLVGLKMATERRPLVFVMVEPKNTISTMQAKALMKKMGIYLKAFNSLAMAEEYLDNYNPQK